MLILGTVETHSGRARIQLESWRLTVWPGVYQAQNQAAALGAERIEDKKMEGKKMGTNYSVFGVLELLPSNLSKS